MFIPDLNVNLLFDPEEQLRIDQALGSPLQVMPDPSQAGKVFIIQKNNTLTILTYAQAKLMMKELDFRSSNNPVHLYMMNPEDYDRYTRGDMPLFRPKIIDRLGQRLASLFTNDMGKVLALMLTFAALPFVNILVAPILFMTSNFFFHLLRYRLAFKRWPNNRETLHILAKSILAGMEVFTGLMILTLLSGISVFAPVAVHLLSILGIAYGGPLITYLVLPLLFATILATGVTLFNLAVVIINHFFDVKGVLSR